MAEKKKNELIFNLWGVLIHVVNYVFTFYTVSTLSRLLENSDWLTPIISLLVIRYLVVTVLWIDTCLHGDFSTKPKKLSTLEKAQRAINKGEYKKQLKEDKEELRRRKGISRELKYIEHAIVVDAKNGYRETIYNIPINYCVKDVELYLQNHGFKAKIDDSQIIYNYNLCPCYPLYIEW